MPYRPDKPLECHLCGSRDLEIAPDYSGLKRVTSDCKPWPAGGILARCGNCELVQTVTTETWQRETGEIYQNYAIFHQGNGIEQSVFTGPDGKAAMRSDVILSLLKEKLPLPATGRLLDFGCGNGGFLRACSSGLPGWALLGAEVNDRYKTQIEEIRGVEQFLSDGIDAVHEPVDLVSLVHVLEHIPDPHSLLQRLRMVLKANGWLLIEVPDCLQNPFVLPIADHCSHFSTGMLAELVAAAGYQVLYATTGWVPREITIVAQKPVPDLTSRSPRLPAEEARQVFTGHRWLEQVRTSVASLCQLANFGIFGTSIAGTWLHHQMGGRTQFFVDEDPSRIGRKHLGKPVLSVGDVPQDAHVYLGLAPASARSVANRLRRFAVTWHVPPELDCKKS